MTRSAPAWTGRNAAAPAVVVLLLLVQAIFVTPAAADFGRLAAFANDLRAGLQAQSANNGGGATTVMARVWTSEAAGPAAGCGFAFLVNDDARTSAHVPRFERATCAVRGAAASAAADGPRVHQRVQFVRPGATYEAALTVPAARVDNVTFTSNGGDGLEIDALCLGFDHSGGGPHAFCVDRQMLDACVAYGYTSGNVSLGHGARGGIRLSRAFAGRDAPRCKEIVFRDVGALARGFELLALGDVGARSVVCSRVDLVAETSAWAYDAAKCYARRDDADGHYYVKTDAAHLRDDCSRSATGDQDADAAFTTAKTTSG